MENIYIRVRPENEKNSKKKAWTDSKININNTTEA